MGRCVLWGAQGYQVAAGSDSLIERVHSKSTVGLHDHIYILSCGIHLENFKEVGEVYVISKFWFFDFSNFLNLPYNPKT